MSQELYPSSGDPLTDAELRATAVPVDGSGVTQPVSASSLPLPTGASTAAKQPALGTAGTPSADVISIQGVTGGEPVEVTGSFTVTGALTDLELRASPVEVDGSGVTQPVSASSLPLPTGAATETTVATLLQEGTDITGASMPSGGAHGMGWLSAIWKAITDRLPSSLVSGRLDVSVGATVGLTDTELRAMAVPVDGSGVTQPVSASSLPLPTGAATAAKQPAMGTAGSPSTDVITVQAIIGGVAFPTYFNGIQVHDSAHDGNLLGVGGYASAATPSAVSADGDAVHAWFDLYGRLNTRNLPLKTPVALVTRTGVTTSYTSATLDTPYGRGVQLIVNVSAAPGAQTISINLYSITNTFGVPALTAANVINNTGSFFVELYPGVTEIAATAGPAIVNRRVSGALADRFLVNLAHSGAGSWTYTVQYCLIP